MIIEASYNGESVVITTSTNEPDKVTTYRVSPGASKEIQDKIKVTTLVGTGAFGHLLSGSVNNRDLVSALGTAGFRIENVEPALEPYVFPEGTIS